MIAPRTAARALIAAAACALGCAWALPARAGGFELTTHGARANGRAGAVTAGGDSPMSLFHNPANIGRDAMPFALAGSLNLHFTHRCMQRVEVVETEDGRQEGGQLPEVCGEGPPGVVPQLAFSMRVTDRLRFGAGIHVPPVAERRIRFGDPDTVTFDSNGVPIPTPTRYLLVEQDLLQLFPTVGFAYEPHPRVRLGATFGWGITHMDFTTTTYSRVQVNTVIPVDVTAVADARTRLEGTDGFTPRVTLGAWSQPIEAVPLELGASFTWTGTVRTNDATLHLDSVHTRLEPAFFEDLVDLDAIEASARIDGVRVRVPQTSQLAFGVRYAQPLASPADDIGDRLSTERFDVELGVVLTFGRRVDRFTVDLPSGAQLVVPSPDPLLAGDTVVELPERFEVEHRWRTQVALRLGGDYNVLPGVLAVRGGVSYESHGVQRGYPQLDFQPFTRVGLHVGGTWRLAGRVDLSVAYAHLFQPDVNVSVQDAALRRGVGGDADPQNPEHAAIVNAGRFSSRYNVLVLEAAARF
jgi:hypothetical protein